MAQFYTLEEAARALGMDSEELKQKAQRREVRAFLDSGSWRFRVSDIDELARRTGMGSDPDLSHSDLDLPGGDPAPGAFDTDEEGSLLDSDFQLGVVSEGDAPVQGSMSDEDILLDDAGLPMGGGSSSHIIGMDAPGKAPSDSDVRLVPEGPKGASDSDVQLSGEFASQPPPRPTSNSDADVTLVHEGSDDSIEAFSPLESGPASAQRRDDADSDLSGETTLRPSPITDSDDFKPVAEAEGSSAVDEDSDFELTPSSVIDALQPDSGSDFELTALDASDEFESTAPRPSDSDVTGVEPSSSGVNLGQPSDSGINLQTMGDLEDADSIELSPIEDEDDAPKRPAPKAKAKAKAKAKPEPDPQFDPSATALPTKSPISDPSATALPVKDQLQKDIFDDTDFEVDALDSGDDQTMQLEGDSDFDLDDSDSASEVFALDEDDVDQNAATAMGPGVLEADDALGDAMDDSGGLADEMSDAAWSDSGAASAPAAASAAPAAGRSRGGSALLSDAGGPPWSGIWVSVLGVTTVLMMVLAFITMDVVRNLNSFQSDTPVASGLVTMIAGGE